MILIFLEYFIRASQHSAQKERIIFVLCVTSFCRLRKYFQRDYNPKVKTMDLSNTVIDECHDIEWVKE